MKTAPIEFVSEWISHFETLSLDSSGYWVFENCGEHGENTICIQFKRAQSPKCWSIWIQGLESETKRISGRKNFAECIQGLNLNEQKVISELKAHLLTQAGGADEFVRQVGSLVGQSALREAIKCTQDFISAIENSVLQQLPQTNSMRETALENFSPQKATPPQAKLRLVSSILKAKPD
jgi:hypothetical protein